MKPDNGDAPASRGVLRRVIALFDPAEPGFLRRMAATGLTVLVLGGCVAATLAVRLSSTTIGRYWSAVLLLEAGRPAEAEGIARGLVADTEARAYGHYRVLAAALRRQGKDQDQLEVLDEAVAVFPELDVAHGHRCWYYALFDDPGRAMDSCDRAVSLAHRDNEGKAFFWRAAARAVLGDGAGAIGDLEAAEAAWSAGSRAGPEYRSTAESWLETLRAGGQPLDADEIARVRKWF